MPDEQVIGAFGVFYKERVIAAGGYQRDTVGEDMELCVRLHRQLRKARKPYRITFLPDPICWTEAPEDLRSLRRQRMRWQQGMAESLIPNWRMMFQRNAGAVGWLAYPFMLLFELFGPVIEVLGYLSMIVLGLSGHLSPEAWGRAQDISIDYAVMEKTGRAVVVHEAPKSFGPGAERFTSRCGSATAA